MTMTLLFDGRNIAARAPGDPHPIARSSPRREAGVRGACLALGVGVLSGGCFAVGLLALGFSPGAWVRAYGSELLIAAGLVALLSIGRRVFAMAGRREADLRDCLAGAEQVVAFCADLAGRITPIEAALPQPAAPDLVPLLRGCAGIGRWNGRLARRGRAVAAIPDRLLAITRPELRWVHAQARLRDAEAFAGSLRRRIRVARS